VGFTDLIRLPQKDVQELAQMRELVKASDGPITEELIEKLRPLLDAVRDNSNQFGPTVASAVGIIKVIALTVNLIGIGALCASFWVIRTATLRPLEDALQTARRISNGDLATPIAAHANDEMGQLMQALADMRDSLARVVGDVRQRSESVASSMSEVATGQADLSNRTEQQAATIQQTAGSVEQISKSVQSSVESAKHADRQAAEASNMATVGGQTVNEVVQSMSEILSSSKKISDIIAVIDGIAFQTNILALNAAVEAARAGEQGRGFAVVAGEVRSLAQRSASAAKEISNLINDSVEKVESGAALVTQAGRTIGEAVTSVQKVSDLISQVSSALDEQAGEIVSIDRAMSQLDQATQQNAALAEQSAAAVESMRSESTALVSAVGQFKLA